MALQIVQFRDNELHPNSPTVKVIVNNLQKLLESAGSRPLSIISICGPPNLGKSFLLNYILRCLDAAQNGRDDWLDKQNPQKPCQGFRPETKGICVWHKAFILKNVRGKEFAVVVMDTQGISADCSENSLSNGILGICLLLSSITILNLASSDFFEVFKSLKIFSEFGSSTMNNQVEKPFQKLTLLMREWKESGKFSVGGDGGTKYLKAKLKLAEKKSQTAGKEVRNYFSDLDCYLMPCPGDGVTKPNYNGNYGALSAQFKVNLEELVTELVESDVRRRKVGGKVWTANDFILHLVIYSHAIGADGFKNELNIYCVHSVCNTNLFPSILTQYEMHFEKIHAGSQYFTKTEFTAVHNEAEKNCSSQLKEVVNSLDKGKFALNEQLTTFSNVLKDLIQWKRKSLQKKNEEKLTKAWENARKTAQEIFRLQFVEFITKTAGNKNFILKKADSVKGLALTGMLEKLNGNETEADIEELWGPLKKQFEETVNSLLPKASAKKEKSEVVCKNDPDKLACFSCPICFEVPTRKVFQCKNGHVICERCCENVRQCPQCRIALTGSDKIRNRALEDIIKNLNLSK